MSKINLSVADRYTGEPTGKSLLLDVDSIMSVEEFKLSKPCSVIIMKEVIHHFNHEDEPHLAQSEYCVTEPVSVIELRMKNSVQS